MSHVENQVNVIPGRENSEYKGPGAERKLLLISRNRKEAGEVVLVKQGGEAGLAALATSGIHYNKEG